MTKHATNQGPQEITVRGRPVAVVISRELFDRIGGSRISLADFVRQSPLHGQEDISFERDQRLPR